MFLIENFVSCDIYKQIRTSADVVECTAARSIPPITKKYEETKGVIRSRNLQKDRQPMASRSRMIYKTLHRKQ